MPKIEVVEAEPGRAPPYGFAFGAGGKTLEPEPREQAALGVIRRLRATGFSVREIRARLEEWGVPPRGSRWHLTTLQRILRRQRAEGLQGQMKGPRGQA